MKRVKKNERAPLSRRNMSRYSSSSGIAEESHGSMGIKSLIAIVTPLRARSIRNSIRVTEKVAAVFTAERVTMVCS